VRDQQHYGATSPTAPTTRPSDPGHPAQDRRAAKGLIQRRPRSNTYQLTAEGQRVAIFYTKVHDRLLRPLIAADQPPAPAELRNALKIIDHHIAIYTDNARLPNAA
jgi:predicted MarR family transcription regulator